MNTLDSAEDVAFRDEVRAFLRDHLPADLSRKVLEHRTLVKADYMRWQDILSAEGLARRPLAEGVRRPRLDAGPDPYLRRRGVDGRRAARGAVRRQPGGVRPHRLRHARPAGAIPDSASEPTRTGGARAIPNRAPDRTWRRCQTRADLCDDGTHYVVNGQKTWTTQAHYADMMFCLVRTSRESAQAGRDHVPADRHEERGDHGAAAADAGRGTLGQRRVLRRRAGAGRQSHRRGGQGLDLRQVPAGLRAHRRRRPGRVQARARVAEGDRAIRDARRPSAGRGSAFRRQDRAGRDRADGARHDGDARAVRPRQGARSGGVHPQDQGHRGAADCWPN